MKKLLFFLLFLFMTITSTMAQQDVCSVVRTIMNEAKGLVNKGKNADALALLRAAQAQPELRSCVDYGLLSEEIERIETNQYLVIPVNDSISITMIKVEGGTFMMGATEEQGDDAKEDEYPVHQVTLSDYYIAQEQVTVDLWDALMTPKPDMRKYSSFAVMIYWYECNSFIRKLNQLTGRKFRLLTEAEWEYAARGGNRSQGYKYSGSNNLNSVAWYRDNSGETTHDVGQKSPNELSIYDMSGNVSEWCSDWDDRNYYRSSPQTNPLGPSSGSYRVSRGGCWSYFARYCRVSDRSSDYPDIRNNRLGLRLAH